MLRERLLVSCLLIPSLVGLFAWDHTLGAPAPVLLVLLAVLAMRLAYELVQLLHRRDLQATWPLTGVAAAALVSLPPAPPQPLGKHPPTAAEEVVVCWK